MSSKEPINFVMTKDETGALDAAGVAAGVNTRIGGLRFLLPDVDFLKAIGTERFQSFMSAREALENRPKALKLMMEILKIGATPPPENARVEPRSLSLQARAVAHFTDPIAPVSKLFLTFNNAMAREEGFGLKQIAGVWCAVGPGDNESQISEKIEAYRQYMAEMKTK